MHTSFYVAIPNHSGPGARPRHKHTTLRVPRYRVMFPYRHQNEDELDLEEGDMIQVLEQCPDGW